MCFPHTTVVACQLVLAFQSKGRLPVFTTGAIFASCAAADHCCFKYSCCEVGCRKMGSGHPSFWWVWNFTGEPLGFFHSNTQLLVELPLPWSLTVSLVGGWQGAISFFVLGNFQYHQFSVEGCRNVTHGFVTLFLASLGWSLMVWLLLNNSFMSHHESPIFGHREFTLTFTSSLEAPAASSWRLLIWLQLLCFLVSVCQDSHWWSGCCFLTCLSWPVHWIAFCHCNHG